MKLDLKTEQKYINGFNWAIDTLFKNNDMSYHEGSNYGEQNGYGKNDTKPKEIKAGQKVDYTYRGKKYVGKTVYTADKDADMYRVEWMPSSSIYLTIEQITLTSPSGY